MGLYYIELQDESDFIDSINGEGFEVEAIDMPSGYILEWNEPEYYPNLVFENENAVTEAVVNGIGVPVYEIIGGIHSPQRPK